ncbi:MAG: glutathione S-transferase family protein, partial [Steroidobacteraceae bacterium]
RLQMYHKKITAEIEPPPTELYTDAYRALVPFGKVPALITDIQVNGKPQVFIESQVIMEYLEDKFPRSPMRPSNAEELATMREITQVNDNYVTQPLTRLFNLKFRPTGNETQEAARAAAADLKADLVRVQALFGKGPYAIGDSLTLADCTLVPTLHFSSVLAQLLDVPVPFADLPRLSGWWALMTQDRNVATVREEMDASMQHAHPVAQ